MTCRQEILDVAATLTAGRTSKTFTVKEVVEALQANGTTFAENTIRTHVASSMCINAPANHRTRYPDLKRTGHGRYELV
ncbi:DUF7669 domain-containing protein [Deinococcus sp. UYEF24]